MIYIKKVSEMIIKRNLVIPVILGFMLIGCGGSSDSNTQAQTDLVQIQPDPEQTPVQPDQVPLEEDTTEVKPSNWYIRIVAQDLNLGLKSQNALLGMLEEKDAVQKHTLKTRGSFDGYLDVLFINPDGVAEGQYKTNYHTFQNETEEIWTFSVMSRDTNANISLSWRGLYILTPYMDANRQLYREYRSTTNPLSKQMKLVDTQTNEEMAAVSNGEVQTYTFNMDGSTERTFKWVVATEEVNITKVVSKTFSQKIVTQEAKSEQQAAFKQERIESFDLNNPPMLQEER